MLVTHVMLNVDLDKLTDCSHEYQNPLFTLCLAGALLDFAQFITVLSALLQCKATVGGFNVSGKYGRANYADDGLRRS